MVSTRLNITKTPISGLEYLFEGRHLDGRIVFSFRARVDDPTINTLIKSYSKGYVPYFHIPVKYDGGVGAYTPVHYGDNKRALTFDLKKEAVAFAKTHKIPQSNIVRFGNRFGCCYAISTSQNMIQSPEVFERDFSLF